LVSNSKPNLIIRADAGAKIGSGHLMRSFALAQNWRAETGGAVIFITNCESVALREKLKNEAFEIVEIENSYPHPTDFAVMQKILKNYPRVWCVVDGYHFDMTFHGLIRQSGNQILVIDDTAHLSFYNADAILNQNINADELHYNCPKDTILLFGTDYALLRGEFSKWRNWQRISPTTARKILITMGGSDFHNQTLKAIRALGRLKIEHLDVKAVVGANNPHLSDLQKAIDESGIYIELICAAENMAELMAWADVAIAAAGSTCWEMALLQLPCILLITAENQTGIADGLHKKGFAENLGWFEQISETDLIKSLSEILPAADQRRKMSETGRGIVDGRGAARVVEFLSNHS